MTHSGRRETCSMSHHSLAAPLGERGHITKVEAFDAEAGPLTPPALAILTRLLLFRQWPSLDLFPVGKLKQVLKVSPYF